MTFDNILWFISGEIITFVIMSILSVGKGRPMKKPLTILSGAITVVFAIAFIIHFVKFQKYGYSCVHGIQMIFYGMNAWGFGILAAISGGKK